MEWWLSWAPVVVLVLLFAAAERNRRAAILRAEGLAQGLRTVFEVARGLDARTMGLPYLDALRALGSSPATQIVVPLEFTSLLRPFAGTPGEGGAGR